MEPLGYFTFIMYLARETKNKKIRFSIRHSFMENGIYKSRNLFNLGTDPSKYIIYPGGNGYYFDPVVEETVEKKGLTISQDELDSVFWEFLDPQIKRVINGFQRDSGTASMGEKNSTERNRPVHIFDKRRLHYLKFASMDQRRIEDMPEKIYCVLCRKSRDEIEQYFIKAETVLRPNEYVTYVFVIFDLQKHFNQSFKRHFPAGLNQAEMDDALIREVCDLSGDNDFWAGMPHETGLRSYLLKYVLIYFDYDFPRRSPIDDYLSDFRNRHRVYRAPEKIRLRMAEAAGLFGVDRKTLGKMDAGELTRLYRQLAMKHHPDTGGEQKSFVKLTEVYRKLLKKKSRP